MAAQRKTATRTTAKRVTTKPAAKKAAAKKSAGLKTKPTGASIEAFLEAIESPTVRADCEALVALMRKVTGEPPKLWGPSMIGFGSYHYKYESGREGDFFLTGFSPRAKNLTLYVMPGFERYGAELAKLGKHKLGKSCLYLDGLAGKDLGALEAILRDAVERMRDRA